MNAKALTEMVSAAADETLVDWPLNARQSLVEATREVLDEEELQSVVLSESTRKALESSMRNYLSTFPPWERMDEDRLRLRQAYLAWRLKSFLASEPPSSEERAEIARQADAVCEIAANWLTTQCKDLPGEAREEALTRLRRELSAAQENLLTVQFLKPLVPDVHRQVLGEYQASLMKVDPAESVTAPVLLEASDGSVGSRRNHEIAASLYGRLSVIFQLRKQFGTPEPEALQDIKRARHLTSERRNELLRAAAEHEVAVRNARSEVGAVLQAYDVIELLIGAIDSLTGHIPMCPDAIAASANMLERGSTDHGERPFATIYRVQMQTDPYGINDADFQDLVHGDMTVAMVRDPEHVRVEIVGRNPGWRARGLLHEPVGLAVLGSEERFDVYCPGWDGPKFASVSAVPKIEISSSPKSNLARIPLASRSGLFGRTLANHVLRRSGGEIQSNVSEGSETARPTSLEWKRVSPYLYMAELTTASVSVRNVDPAKHRSGRVEFFAKQEPTKTCAVLDYERTPDDVGGVLTVRTVVEEPALRIGNPAARPPVTIADSRTIEFEIGSVPGRNSKRVLRTGIIRDAQKREIVRLSLHDVVLLESLPEGFADVRQPISRIGEAAFQWDYYRIRKALYLANDSSGDARDAILKDVVVQSEELQQRLSQHPPTDFNLLLAAEHIAMDAKKLSDDIVGAENDTVDHLRHIVDVADKRQRQLEFGWAISYSAGRGTAAGLEKIANLYAEQLDKNMRSNEALQRSLLYRTTGNWILCARLVAHGRDRAPDAVARHTLTLELASAWTEVAADLRERRKTWSLGDTQKYVQSAKDELEAFEESASPEERARHRNLLERVQMKIKQLDEQASSR